MPALRVPSSPHPELEISIIRRNVILESSGIGLTVMEHSVPDQVWQTTDLTTGDILRRPETGIEVSRDEDSA
jgi:hypothetical protein